MRYTIVLLALLALPAMIEGQTLPVQYKGLVDSLMIAVGTSPTSLVYERPVAPGSALVTAIGEFNVATGGMTLSPMAPRPRHTLAHEFGHLLQFTDMGLFSEWFHQVDRDSLAGPTVDDLEHFADDFADTWEALASHKIKAATRGRRAVIATYLRNRAPFMSESSAR